MSLDMVRTEDLPQPGHREPAVYEPCAIASLEEVWPKVRGQVMKAAAIAGGTHTEIDVIDALCDGRAVLWTNGESGVLCEFEDYPRMRVCRFWLAGGALEDLLPMKETIEDWARAHGASRMDIMGRRGWRKVLGDYDHRADWMTKDL